MSFFFPQKSQGEPKLQTVGGVMFFSIFPLAIPNKVLLSSFNDSAVGTT